MARYLFVNQHYWPDHASTGQHLTDLAEHLAGHGHEVRVLTSRGRGPLDDDAPPRREERGGVEIVRVRASAFGRARASGRLSDYASFHLLAGPRVALSRWADVTVTLTTPPMLGMWGTLARRLRGSKHVVFLMDHHPDAEFEQELIDRWSLTGRALERLYGWTLRGADQVVCLGPYMAERVMQRGVDERRVTTIPIWSRGDEIEPVPHGANALRHELGWTNRFVVLYAGNAGLVHRFDELLGAMSRLAREAPDVLFAFAGGGPRRAEIEDYVRRNGLWNARFLDPVPRERLSELLSAADAHFLSLAPEHVGVSVPSKLYGQLASARPVLFVGARQCETAEDLEASGAGRAFRLGEDDALAREILRLQADPVRRVDLGKRGRAWFLAHRERGRSCEAWRRVLEAVAEGRRVPSFRRVGSSSPVREAV